MSSSVESNLEEYQNSLWYKSLHKILNLSKLFKMYAFEDIGELLTDREVAEMKSNNPTKKEKEKLERYEMLQSLSIEAMYGIETSEKKFFKKMKEYYGDKWLPEWGR